MTDSDSTAREDRQLEVELHVDALCREFELAWRAGRQPRIEDVLAAAPPDQQAALLVELLPLELELRQKAGEEPSPEDYRNRFPRNQELVDRALRDRAPGPAWPVVPGFRLLGELGRGGMGVVYRAEEIALGRVVALKVLLHRSLTDARQKRRFEREAKAAARLHHTNIVPIFGVGQYQGVPYYSMQYISGAGLNVIIAELRREREHSKESAPGRTALLARSLLHGGFTHDLLSDSSSESNVRTDAKSADSGSATGLKTSDPGPKAETPTSTGIDKAPGGRPAVTVNSPRATYWRSIARIGIQVASALDYAHRQGVLHRDIKPSNLLLDPRGTVWVADFGLAKVEDQENLTATGDFLGTLRYLSPEALEGKTGPASDVYALGLTLYELAALRPAFDEVDRTTLLHQVATSSVPPLRSLDPDVPRDLATIIHKATESESRHRYASASDMADDLGRFLVDEPIHARKMSLTEQLWRWSRRNRAVAALGLTVLIVLAAGTVISSYFGIEANRRAGLQKEAALKAELAKGEAVGAKRQTDLLVARLKVKEALRQADSGAVDVGAFGLIEALRLTPKNSEAEDLRVAIRKNLAAWCTQLALLRYIRPLVQDGTASGIGEVWVRPVGPAQETYASWSHGQPLETWDTETGRPTGIRYHLPPNETPLAITRDGTAFLVRIDERASSSIRIRLLRTGDVLGATCAVPGHLKPSMCSQVLSPRFVMISGNGMDAYSGGRNFWDLEKGITYPLYLDDHGAPSFHLLLDQTGKPIVMKVRHDEASTRGADWRAEFWDVSTGKPASLPVRFSARGDALVDWHGRSVLTIYGDEFGEPGGVDGSVCWWDAAGRSVDQWRSAREALSSLLAGDGQTLIATGRDGRIRLFDLDTGLQRGGDLALPDNLKLFEMRGIPPGYPVLLSHNGDGLIRAWGLSRLEHQATMASRTRSRLQRREDSSLRFTSAAFSPDAAHVLLSNNGKEGYARLVNTSTGDIVGAPNHRDYQQHCAFSPYGRLVATAPFNYHVENPVDVHIYGTATFKPLFPPLPITNYVFALAFSPDSTTLAVGRIGGIDLLDVSTGKIRGTLHERSVAQSLAFSPDGTRLAVGYRSGWAGLGAGLRLWDVIHGTPLGDFHSLANLMSLPECFFLQEGARLLAFDSHDGRLASFDGLTGQPRPMAPVHGKVRAVAWRSSDPIAALGYDSGAVQQLDLAEGVPLGETMMQPAGVMALAFSPDGNTLAVGCQDNAVRLWDSATALPIGPPLQHSAKVLAVQFTRDGREVVTASAAGEVRRWPVHEAVPDNPDVLDLWIQNYTGRRLEGGEAVVLPAEAWSDCVTRLMAVWPDAALALETRRASSEADVAWHDGRAREAEAAGNTFALVWHLRRLVALRPTDWRVSACLGMALAAGGATSEAGTAFAQASKLCGADQLRDVYAHGAAVAHILGRLDEARWYQARLKSASPGPLH
jgi:serine/threonine protein kinase/WD40 repeat protein